MHIRSMFAASHYNLAYCGFSYVLYCNLPVVLQWIKQKIISVHHKTRSLHAITEHTPFNNQHVVRLSVNKKPLTHTMTQSPVA